MYKHILTAIIITLFIGCSAPSPEKLPTWYTSPPQDLQYFYATGSGINHINAKNNAISNLRTTLNYNLDKAFLDKTTKLKIAQNQDIKLILLENEKFANTITMRGLKIDKTDIFKKEHLVLIKLSRNLVFDYASKLSTKKFEISKSRYESYRDNIAIKKYTFLLDEMPDYYSLASLLEAKILSFNTYDFNEEVLYLDEIRSEFLKLKQSISFYILSDVNSKIYVSAVKDAIIASGLTISSQPIGDNSLNIFITSKTINSQDYTFNKSKTLVKYRTYNQDKKEVAFRQHTFIGKSRVSYIDAKNQSAVYQKNKIKKLGVYNFIGFNQ